MITRATCTHPPSHEYLWLSPEAWLFWLHACWCMHMLTNSGCFRKVMQKIAVTRNNIPRKVGMKNMCLREPCNKSTKLHVFQCVQGVSMDWFEWLYCMQEWTSPEILLLENRKNISHRLSNFRPRLAHLRPLRPHHPSLRVDSGWNHAVEHRVLLSVVEERPSANPARTTATLAFHYTRLVRTRFLSSWNSQAWRSHYSKILAVISPTSQLAASSVLAPLAIGCQSPCCRRLLGLHYSQTRLYSECYRQAIRSHWMRWNPASPSLPAGDCFLMDMGGAQNVLPSFHAMIVLSAKFRVAVSERIFFGPTRFVLATAKGRL